MPMHSLRMEDQPLNLRAQGLNSAALDRGKTSLRQTCNMSTGFMTVLINHRVSYSYDVIPHTHSVHKIPG